MKPTKKVGSRNPESHRRYWVVSPNVKNDKKTVGKWREASVRHHTAFMGWGPDDRHHQSGPKFAGKMKDGIKEDDIILIARQHDRKPEIVGFGVVSGKAATRLKGFNAPDGQPFGSLRPLRPFKPWSRAPSDIPLIDALRHKGALAQLHPDRNNAHEKVCKWLERRLGRTGRQIGERSGASARNNTSDRPTQRNDIIDLVDLERNPQLDYTRRTNGEVKRVKAIESELLHDYRDWLNKQRRKLSFAKYRRLSCDGYEKKRNNLIEAKSSIRREYIRMAVGQLLDYSFQGKRKFGDPNMALLLPTKPNSDIREWLTHLKIAIVWREGNSFFDNANGLFT